MSTWTRREFLTTTANAIFASTSGMAKSIATEDPGAQILRQAINLAGKKNYKIKILYPTGSLGNLKPLVAEFRDATGVDFELQATHVNRINSVMLIVANSPASKRSFDVAIPATYGLPDLINAGSVLELTPFAKKFEPAGFRNTMLYQLGDQYLGKLYGYQTDGDTYLLSLNRNWLEDLDTRKAHEDRYGTALDVPRTWAELDRQIEFFHDPAKGRLGGSLFRLPTFVVSEFWLRLHGNGFYPVDDQMRPQIDTPAGVAALEAMIAVTRFLAPDVHTNGLFANYKSFAEGDKYCNLGWGGTQKALHSENSALRNKLRIVTPPGGIQNGDYYRVPYFNWGRNFTVSAKTQIPELCYLFCAFAVAPRQSTTAVSDASGHFDPFREEHYSDRKVINTYGSDFLAAHRDGMKHAVPDFYLNGQSDYMDALREAIQFAFAGHLSPDRALKHAATKWEKITDKLGRKNQINQWRFLKRSYPKRLKANLKPISVTG